MKSTSTLFPVQPFYLSICLLQVPPLRHSQQVSNTILSDVISSLKHEVVQYIPNDFNNLLPPRSKVPFLSHSPTTMPGLQVTHLL